MIYPMKQLKKGLIFTWLLLSIIGVSAQPISTYFVQMPSHFLPGVSVETRKDLIDFFSNGKVALMPSAFGGKIGIKALSEDCIVLRTSDKGEMQLKKLHLKDTLYVLVLIRTVSAPLLDSRTSVYTTDWKPFNDLKFPILHHKDFIDFAKSNALGLVDFQSQFEPRLFVSLSFMPSSSVLVAKSSLKDDLSLEKDPALKLVVKDSILLQLEGLNYKF